MSNIASMEALLLLLNYVFLYATNNDQQEFALTCPFNAVPSPIDSTLPRAAQPPWPDQAGEAEAPLSVADEGISTSHCSALGVA